MIAPKSDMPVGWSPMPGSARAGAESGDGRTRSMRPVRAQSAVLSKPGRPASSAVAPHAIDVAARRLDLDDVGAEVGHHGGRHGAGDEVGRIDHADAVEQAAHFTSIPTSSTSKMSVAPGGITPPAPRSPYPRCAGIISLRLPPTRIEPTPSSQPLITRPRPIGNTMGSPRSCEESNFWPLLSQPV